MKKKTVLLTLSACTLLVAGGMIFAKNGIKFNSLKADGDYKEIVFNKDSVKNAVDDGYGSSTFDLVGKTEVYNWDFTLKDVTAYGDVSNSAGGDHICECSGAYYTYLSATVTLQNVGDQEVFCTLTGTFDGVGDEVVISYAEGGSYYKEDDKVFLVVYYDSALSFSIDEIKISYTC